MKDLSDIDKMFTKDSLHKVYKAGEEDWLVVREAALKKEKDRKFPVFWLLFGLVVGMIIIVFYHPPVTTDMKDNGIIPTVEVNHNPNNNSGPAQSEEDETLVTPDFSMKDKSPLTSSKITDRNIVVSENMITPAGGKNLDVNETKPELLRNEVYTVPQLFFEVHSKEQAQNEEFIDLSKGQEDHVISMPDERPLCERPDALAGLPLIPSFTTGLFLIQEKITPLQRKIHTPIQLSLVAGLSGKVFGANIKMPMYSIGHTTFYTGIHYQLWNDKTLIISQDQDSYSFGQNSRNASLIANRVHYTGLSLGLRQKVWQNVHVETQLSSLYRLNVEGSQSYWISDQDFRKERINLDNQYSHDFNVSISGELSYAFRKFSVGLGYIQLYQNAYSKSQDDLSNRPDGQFYFTVNINL